MKLRQWMLWKPDAIVGRQDCDEFALLLPGLDDAKQADRDRILQHVSDEVAR